MALKKWVFGTRLAQQITEQNANIDVIDKDLTLLKSLFNTVGNATADIDNMKEGFSFVKSAKLPDATSWYLCKTFYVNNSPNYQIQEFIRPNKPDEILSRHKHNGVWTPFYKFTGTPL